MAKKIDPVVVSILKELGISADEACWNVHGGTWVMYHRYVERAAAAAGITFDPPQIIRAEHDEAVVMVVGRRSEKVEWSFGEALVNTNYRVSGKQAAYVYAMAEKRAKDRVALKLIGLHGFVYSEEEMDERDQEPAREDHDPRADAKAYVSMAKHAVSLCENEAELIKWWQEESGRRREYGVVEGTPEFDELRQAAAHVKAEILRSAA